MAKTIKFNLKLNGNSIRTIEDLKENFVLEEVLKYYKEDLLLRWLKVRNYDEYVEKVGNINNEDDFEVLKQLVNIFDMEQDDSDIEKIIYTLKLEEEQKVLLEDYKNNNFQKQQIIDDYLSGYYQIFEEIEENSENLSKLKVIVSNIEKNYKDLFTMDKFMYGRVKDYIKFIIAILMNENIRDVIVKNEKVMEDFINNYGNKIKEKSIEYFESDLKTFKGNVEYWKDLEQDRKIIILDAKNCVIREPKNRDLEIKHTQLKNKFEILNGLELQSLSDKESEIYYLEV